MIALIWFVLAVLASPFKSKSRLEAENAVLRHQLIVLRRKVRGRAQLTNNDRWFLVQMYRWFQAQQSPARLGGHNAQFASAKSGFGVRRDKAALSSGCKPHP